MVWQLNIYGFTHLALQQKTAQDTVYTPMGGSPAINVILYALFGGSTKMKVKPFTLFFGDSKINNKRD